MAARSAARVPYGGFGTGQRKDSWGLDSAGRDPPRTFITSIVLQVDTPTSGIENPEMLFTTAQHVGATQR